MDEAEIVVGRIVRAHGLRGHLVIQPTSSGSDVLIHVRTLSCEQHGQRRLLTIRDARRQGKLLLLAFEGFPDRTAAERLIGSALVMKQRDLPPPEAGEAYASSLVGLFVESPKGEPLGRIVEIESAGTRAWLVVENEAGRHLVPWTEPLVRIDPERRRAIVDAPPGLLDGTA